MKNQLHKLNRIRTLFPRWSFFANQGESISLWWVVDGKLQKKVLPHSKERKFFSWIHFFYNPESNFRLWQISRLEESVREDPMHPEDREILQKILDQELGRQGESFVVQGDRRDGS